MRARTYVDTVCMCVCAIGRSVHCVHACVVIIRARAVTHIYTSCLPWSASVLWGRKQGRGPSSAQLRVPNKGARTAPWPPLQRMFTDVWILAYPALGGKETYLSALGLKTALKPLPELDPRRFCLAQAAYSVLCCSWIV